MSDTTIISLKEETISGLDRLKLSPDESYDDVISRLMVEVADDQPLSPEVVDIVEEALSEYRSNKCITLEQIEEELGVS